MLVRNGCRARHIENRRLEERKEKPINIMKMRLQKELRSTQRQLLRNEFKKKRTWKMRLGKMRQKPIHI